MFELSCNNIICIFRDNRIQMTREQNLLVFEDYEIESILFNFGFKIINVIIFL